MTTNSIDALQAWVFNAAPGRWRCADIKIVSNNGIRIELEENDSTVVTFKAHCGNEPFQAAVAHVLLKAEGKCP